MQFMAQTYFTYEEGLKDVADQKLNRLSQMHITNSRDFFDAMTYLSSSTSVRCILMGSRRTDPGCRDLSGIDLMETAPILMSSTLCRLRHGDVDVRPRDLRIGYDAEGSLLEPSLIRVSPILEWSYRDIWDFMQAVDAPYCSLYDQGFTSIGSILDTVRNPMLLRSRMTAKPAPAASEREARRMLGAKYDEMEKAKIQTYKELGAGMYEDGLLKRWTATTGQDANYLPAWTLTDESKEDASRIRSESLGHVHVRGIAEAADSAAIIMIGDEIVSGIDEETCSYFVGVALRRAGVAVKQVMKIENDVDVIAFMVRCLQISDSIYI